MISKKERLRNYLSSKGKFTWAEAKGFYDAMGGADVSYTGIMVNRYLNEWATRTARGEYQFNKPTAPRAAACPACPPPAPPPPKANPAPRSAELSIKGLTDEINSLLSIMGEAGVGFFELPFPAPKVAKPAAVESAAPQPTATGQRAAAECKDWRAALYSHPAFPHLLDAIKYHNEKTGAKKGEARYLDVDYYNPFWIALHNRAHMRLVRALPQNAQGFEVSVPLVSLISQIYLEAEKKGW